MPAGPATGTGRDAGPRVTVPVKPWALALLKAGGGRRLRLAAARVAGCESEQHAPSLGPWDPE
jgi:hypothetical protein